ncbi:MAG: c-type cytochrome [Trueperaceae bacterium]
MRRLYVLLLITIGMGLTITSAQQASSPSVTVGEHEELGAYLTDAEGRSLYLFTNDEQGGSSSCFDQCAENWPPVVVQGEPTAGEGANESLLGTVERDDGAVQLTYHGWPLYYFVRDEEPGATAGQAVGGVWYLVSAEGEAVGAPAVEEDEGAAEGEDGAAAEGTAREGGVSVDVMSQGETVYQQYCAGCHGQEGGGLEGPRLANNSNMGDEQLVLGQIIRGGDYMPAFGNLLSDDAIAAVATYIRNSWENDFGPVTEEQVNEAR